VQIPTYSSASPSRFSSPCAEIAPEVHRDERYFFPRTQEFWPERWTSEGEADAATRSEAFRLVHAAYMPFSFGSWNCVGKGLAILELRKTLAALVRRFDFRLGDTFDKKEWDAEAKDHFSLTCGRLPVVIRERV
jgi:cytochrome P450